MLGRRAHLGTHVPRMRTCTGRVRLGGVHTPGHVLLGVRAPGIGCASKHVLLSVLLDVLLQAHASGALVLIEMFQFF